MINKVRPSTTSGSDVLILTLSGTLTPGRYGGFSRWSFNSAAISGSHTQSAMSRPAAAIVMANAVPHPPAPMMAIRLVMVFLRIRVCASSRFVLFDFGVHRSPRFHHAFDKIKPIGQKRAEIGICRFLNGCDKFASHRPVFRASQRNMCAERLFVRPHSHFLQCLFDVSGKRRQGFGFETRPQDARL